MRRLILIFWMLLAITLPATGGELSLLSNQVNNGEVAVLNWHGGPLSFGVVRFLDQVIYLYPDRDGAVALLPVGLDTPAGVYALPAALVDRQGRTTAVELSLRVVDKQRPLEQLTLPARQVTPEQEDLVRIEREGSLLQQKYSLRSPRSWTGFVRPLAGPVSSVFGKRRIMNGLPKSPHSGTDFRSPAGTPVHAISDGRVVLVDDLFYTGTTVVVDHGEGLISLYAHLSKSLVRESQLLLAGELLGEVGSTGRSTGPHLHLTVRLLGERIDPLSLLAAFGVSEPAADPAPDNR